MTRPPVCACGCGERTKRVTRTQRHYRYVVGHNRRKPAAERIWAFIDKTPACWLWTGARNDAGYGQLHLGGRTVFAHRTVYELLVGPIPDGLQLDHLCRTPLCVRPTHLEPVSPAQNIRRGMSPSAILWRSGHCSHGHRWTPENTYQRPDGKGRQCRACIAIRLLRRKERAGA